MDDRPDFSIITPSYNMLDYLKLCCASIADQEGVNVEHIVVDGGSRDGTVEWLKCNPRVISISEKDHGMYDALNKGILLARGRFVGHLNADEQYLPGTLQAVLQQFSATPLADVVFGDVLYVTADGHLTHFRKSYPPRWQYIQTAHLYIMTCSLFMRHSIFEEGHRYDEQYRVIADADLLVRLLQSGFRFVHLRRYLAAFTLTGSNLMLSGTGALELERYRRTAPAWLRALSVPMNLVRLMEKLVSGAYWQRKPIEYAIYTSDSGIMRSAFRASRASAVVWHHRALER